MAVTLYDLASKVAYVCDDRLMLTHRTVEIDEMDMEILSASYEVGLNIDCTIVLPSQPSKSAKVQLVKGQMDVASIINKFNRLYIKGKSPLIVEYLSICGDEVMVTNTCNEDVFLYLYVYDVIEVIPAGGTCMIAAPRFLNTRRRDDDFVVPYVITSEVPILHLKATLQRKNNGGFYTREETLTITSGFFKSEEELVDHINKCITMRGERNGFIYHVEIKYGEFIIHATHRQPKGSTIEVTPMLWTIGFPKKATFPIVTKAKLVGSFQCGRLLESQAHFRRLY